MVGEGAGRFPMTAEHMAHMRNCLRREVSELRFQRYGDLILWAG